MSFVSSRPSFQFATNCLFTSLMRTRQNCLVSNCVHTADKTRQFCHVSTQFRWGLSRLDPVSNLQLIACSHRWCGPDKTVLSCLQLCSHCRHGQDKTVLSHPLCEHNWRRNCLVLSASAVWTLLVHSVLRCGGRRHTVNATMLCRHKCPEWFVQNKNSTTEYALTLSPPTPLRLYTLPYWYNPPFLIFDIRALALRTERHSARMSKIKNGWVRPVWRWTVRTAAIWNSWRWRG